MKLQSRVVVITEVLLVLANYVSPQSLLSCFFQSADAPCPFTNLKFWLYSGSQQEGEKIQLMEPNWLKSSRFNTSMPTVMLVHGNGGGEHTPIVTLKKAYQKRGTHNIIMVDWGYFAQDHCYFWSVWNVSPVSKCIAHMLEFLRTSGVNTEDITCIGHSLGAHVCGVVANYLSYKLNRIVGLDPAWPLKHFSSSKDRLDKNDAKIVQVIHADTSFYGLPNMQGTVDFCINNGAQPFCEHTSNPQVCSHLQSICFYAASLFPNKATLGVPCKKSCPTRNKNITLPGAHVTMGEHMENSAEGMYCVRVLEPPYCLNSRIDPEYGDLKCCPS